MGFMYVVWIGVIVLAVVLEMATEQLVSIWFVFGGLVGIIANGVGLELWVQILTASIVTLLMLLVTRPIVKRKLSFEKTKTNADRNVGQTAVVLEEVNNSIAKGLVRIGSAVWTARADENEVIPVDAEVMVVRIEGVKAIVAPSPGGQGTS